MKKLAALSVSAFAIATVLAIPAQAAEVITIPIDKIIYGDEGGVYPFETADVPAEFVGWVCVGEGVTDNNESEHPNNDMIITSGGTSVEIPDVESLQGGQHNIEGNLVLGDVIEVFVRLGSDGVSSGAFDIVLICDAPVPATTTTVPVPLGPTVVTNPCDPTTTDPATGATATGTDDCPSPATPTTALTPLGPTVVSVPCDPTTNGSTTGTDANGQPCTAVPATPSTTAPAPLGPTATLPVTGSSTTYLVASTGFALLGAGVALLALVQIGASRIRFSRVRSK